ncbi:MAG: phage tail tape measure protein [Bdellovibrionota bacterium]
MAKKFSLEYAIRAADKSIAVLNRFNRRIEDVGKPVSKLNNKLRALGRAAGFDRIIGDFGKLHRKASDVAGAVGTALRRISLMGAAAGGAFFLLLNSTARAGEEISKLSGDVGISTAAIQGLALGASRADLSTEALRDSLEKFSKSAGNAALKGAGPAAFAFNALGVRLRDNAGRLKSNEALLGETADALRKVRNENLRNAIAFRLFGTNYARMLELLSSGSRGIADLTKEAQGRAGFFDPQEIARARAFDAAMKEFRGSAAGLRNELGQRLLPAATALIEAFNKFLQSERGRQVIDRLTQSLEAFIPAPEEAGQTIGRLLDQFDKFWGIVTAVSNFVGGPANLALLSMGAIIGGPVLAAVAALIPAIMALGTTIGVTPIGWFIAGATGLVLGLRYLYGWIVKISQAFSNGGFLFGFLELINFINPITHLWKILKGIWAVLTGAVSLAAKLGVGIAKLGAWAVTASTEEAPPKSNVPSPKALAGVQGGEIVRSMAGARGRPPEAPRGTIEVTLKNAPPGTRIQAKEAKGINLETWARMGPNMVPDPA